MVRVSEEAWAGHSPCQIPRDYGRLHVWVCFDNDLSGRRKEPIGTLTGREGLFDEADRLAYDLTVLDGCGECVVVNGSARLVGSGVLPLTSRLGARRAPGSNNIETGRTCPDNELGLMSS
jgi:hypothetical protein